MSTRALHPEPVARPTPGFEGHDHGLPTRRMATERAAAERTAMHARVVSVGGVNWYVQQGGAGPAMMLVHGTGASGDSFVPLMPLLAEHFTLIVPDLPGHARTTVPRRFRADLPTFAASLDALLGVLDVEPAYVLGHSAGAAVLVRMILDEMLAPALMVGVAAALVPFQGLAGVLFPGAARLLARTSVAPAFIAARANDEAVERVLQGTGSNLDQAALARYQRLVQQPSHIAGVLSMLSRWQPGATFDQLPSLRTPLELIAGANDLAVPMAQTQQLLARAPRARLTVVPQAGHLVHEERPEAVLSVVLKAAAIGRSDKVRQSKK